MNSAASRTATKFRRRPSQCRSCASAYVSALCEESSSPRFFALSALLQHKPSRRYPVALVCSTPQNRQGWTEGGRGATALHSAVWYQYRLFLAAVTCVDLSMVTSCRAPPGNPRVYDIKGDDTLCQRPEPPPTAPVRVVAGSADRNTRHAEVLGNQPQAAALDVRS